MMEQRFQAYRDRLVEELKAQGITSQEVLQAFASVPRHRFVQMYYERQAGQCDWVSQEARNTEEWYQRIYSDRPFITLIDAVGRTLSSSSAPGIMAQMLSALEVRPEHHVLEIGTGTGYNAALLAYLSGDPDLVTTIDIDPRATEPARKTLSALGYGSMTILTQDGRQGYQPGAPYDRIIATASTPIIPEQWNEQLALGGILVAVLQPGIAMGGGVLQAVKHQKDLSGRLLYEASFMPLHDAQFEHLPSRAPRINMNIPVLDLFSYASHLFDPTVVWEPNFQFFLYATCPNVHIIEQQRESSEIIYTLFFDEEEPDTYVAFFEEQNSQKVELRGEKARILWTQLIRVYTLWQNVGKPAITEYGFEMDREGQRCFLQGNYGTVWPFLAWTH